MEKKFPKICSGGMPIQQSDGTEDEDDEIKGHCYEGYIFRIVKPLAPEDKWHLLKKKVVLRRPGLV